MKILAFDRDTDKKVKITAFLTLLISFGLAGWTASFINFSSEVANINSLDLGIIWSVKEIPVLLGFILAIILSFISESRILGVFVAISGFGIILTGFANYDMLGDTLYNNFVFSKFTFHMIVITFILSIGFNYFHTAKDNLIMHSTSSEKTAVYMGKIAGYGLVGTIAGYLIITILGFINFSDDPEIKYTIIYIIIGLPLIIGGVLGSQQADPSKNLKENIEIFFKMKFLRYYILTFFSSSIYYLFIIYGTYQLVSKFSVSLGIIGGIFLVRSLSVYFFKIKVPDFINSKGIAFIMQLKFGGELIILLCYAFVPEKFTLIGLFVVFVILQLFESIVKTYMQGISQPHEMRTNLVLFDRITNFSAIIIPAVTGFLWFEMGDNGSMVIFILGSAIALICLIISFFLYPSSLFEDN